MDCGGFAVSTAWHVGTPSNLLLACVCPCMLYEEQDQNSESDENSVKRWAQQHALS